MLRLHGIRNCDTVRRARRWLEARGLDYDFHDFRTEGLAAETLADWLERAGCTALVNRRSATWRGLAPEARRRIEAGDCLEVLLAHPTLLRRPVVEHPGGLLVGFDPATWQAVLE
ncbi:MAG: arsenate reductase [Gammaproteobacteria bacterium]|nr:MAG: arsenate reductase [Gammaproteobacteria bacterium]